ncbi:response regulator transcription factor [Alicyclobacillus sp. ALC3]|uniref:response regulator transcription factor n=1 Tax=Alicyclobacillus sp. ALC3 TaxID=2796143 RepID=UPI002379DAF7|nr:response regulator transcription factor [Alicyclobacillus sp. ALC3]WDL95751.1 response regulator transcription factor [Alicyclobacillus sp. ALC3]
MIRICIAEDQALVRGALAALLDLQEDIEVVAQATDGQEAIDLCLEHKPDVALVDIEMPVLSGLDVTQVLSERLPSCAVLIVTTFARPGYLQRAMTFGAKGYVLKDAEIDDLVKAIRIVHAGGTVMDPTLMREAWQAQNPLSQREMELLRRAREGTSTKDLARLLFLSEGTVRNYWSDILSKLHVSSRQEAIQLAIDKGWV